MLSAAKRLYTLVLPLLRYCLPVIDKIRRIAKNQFCILNYFSSILVFTSITRNTEYQYCDLWDLLRGNDL